MANEEEIHRNKLTGKTYISPQVPTLTGLFALHPN